MASTKPKLFVGSSTEGLDIARAVALRLADVAEVTVWKDNVFRPNDGNLEALLRSLKYFDFAVFVLSPDDTTTSRGKAQPSPRDNALFEFGLFLGRLDKDHCFAVASDSCDEQGYVLKLPSDLHGVTVARYESNRADKNWAAAVGNACTVIIEEICKIPPQTKQSDQDPGPAPIADAPSEGANKTRDEVLEMLGLKDDGTVVVEKFQDNASDWFHHERFVSAFPGARGVTEFADPRVAAERLQLLLRPPLQWVWRDGEHGALGTTPIWWWRGHGNMPIRDFSMLGPEEVLFDCKELIRRVVAVNTGAYWQSFVYVEAKPKSPTGVYPTMTPEEAEQHIKVFGNVHEEVGFFKNRYVTRSEYDDGFAVLDGKPCKISGAELRIRYLSPYNLVIAPHDSPINNSDFDAKFEPLMNGILTGNATVTNLAKEVGKLPRRYFNS